MSKPLLLDLYCGVGGASVGYHDAGFDVIGVDNQHQPDYPYEFVRADALETIATLVASKGLWHDGRRIHAVHASPPCQPSSALTKGTNAKTRGHLHTVDLIGPTRDLLQQLTIPWVIENVQGAKVRRDLTLCGEMFGLDVIRHRYFECSFPVTQPTHVKHRGRVSGMRHGIWYEGPYAAVYGDGGGKGSVARWQQAMGIDWTDNRKSIAEAIPPAFSQHVGEQLLKVIT